MAAGTLWAVCSLSLSLALSPASATLGSGEDQRVQVLVAEEKQGGIGLEVRQAPLAQVFAEISKKTGVRVIHPALPAEPVSAACRGATVKQVLTCLLGSDADLMFRYSGDAAKDRSEPRLMEVRVLASTFEGGGSAGCAQDSARCGVEVREASDPSRMNPAKTEPEDIGKLLEMAKARDPDERARALERLVSVEGVDEATLYDELEKALSDEDGEVRAQAVSGLALKRGAGAVDILRTALHDSDASVRLMAVDGMAADEQGIALLQEALGDSDETVRSLAALKLKSGPDVNVAR
jgi:hypothetical protein